MYRIGSSNQYPKTIYPNSGMVPVHNHLLTIYLKMGLIGLGMFLFLNIYAVNFTLRNIVSCKVVFLKDLLIAISACLVFWNGLALLYDVIDSPPTSIVLWVLMGLIFAILEVDKKHAGAPR